MFKFSEGCDPGYRVQTKNRAIQTEVSAHGINDSILDKCYNYEHKSMSSQIPIVWQKAKGFNVWDGAGNKWIDLTSGIFVANVGHAHPSIKEAIKTAVDNDLLFAYDYPTSIRADFAEYLIKKICRNKFARVLFQSTGSEANEAAMKMARMRFKYRGCKNIIVSLENSFHGKTMGSQLAGGKLKERKWINGYNTSNIYLPFPYPWALEKEGLNGKEFFEKSIEDLMFYHQISPHDIAGFITEPYQGWCAIFLPRDYAIALKSFCHDNHNVLIIDEVQSGFGRTGKMFAYQHLGITPDIITCGKGISSSLPLSAVLLTEEVSHDTDYSFTSTHGGNTLAVAAGLASTKVLIEEDLVKNSEKMGGILFRELYTWRQENPSQIKGIDGNGLLAGVFIESPDTTNKMDNRNYVDFVIEEGVRRGVLSIRTSSGTLKIGPPLCITEDAIVESIQVLKESMSAVNQRLGAK